MGFDGFGCLLYVDGGMIYDIFGSLLLWMLLWNVLRKLYGIVLLKFFVSGFSGLLIVGL